LGKGPHREGNLEAPTRHRIDWQSDAFYDQGALFGELERVFDICHGCRRCFNLCNAFPTLFDAIDASESGELDTVPRSVFDQVVDHCYLCDMCYMSKCPYVPPHEWNVDFPHLMLRAKARRFREQGAPFRDRVLAATDQVGRLAGIPVVAEVLNRVNRSGPGRRLLEKTLGVDRTAPVPVWHRRSARQRLADQADAAGREYLACGATRGRVVLLTTCYGNRNAPQICEDLAAVFEHNGVPVTLAGSEQCCGMPKLELGDLASVDKARQSNIPQLLRWVRDGWDIVAPVPSCVLMYKQELPLLFPDDEEVRAVAQACFDPFDYLFRRHRAGRLTTNFVKELGRISYQVPCHLRVQNIGLKTRDVLELVPGTHVEVIQRCSGHDGTYGVKRRFREASVRIAQPVVRKVRQAAPDYFTSDCPMAGEQIAAELPDTRYVHPMTLMRQSYGI